MLNSFLRLLTRCYRMALPYGRLKLFGLLGLILFNGLLQLVGVTSVFPFFALATDPGRLQKSKVGSWVLHFFPPLSTNQLLVGAGCFAITMLVFSSLGSMVSEVLRIPTDSATGFAGGCLNPTPSSPMLSSWAAIPPS